MTANTISPSELVKELRAKIQVPRNLKSLNGASCPDCKGTDTVRLGFDVRCGQSAYFCKPCAHKAAEEGNEPKVFHVPMMVLRKEQG